MPRYHFHTDSDTATTTKRVTSFPGASSVWLNTIADCFLTSGLYRAPPPHLGEKQVMGMGLEGSALSGHFRHLGGFS